MRRGVRRPGISAIPRARRIGRAGRAQRAGAQAASLEKELKELSLATSGLVRNRAVLLIAEGLATSGQGEESAEAFAGYYGVNVHTSLDRKRLRGTAAARGFQTWRAFPTLSQLKKLSSARGDKPACPTRRMKSLRRRASS